MTNQHRAGGNASAGAPVLGRHVCGNLEQAIGYEWLVTNGLGGFAAGTVCTARIRRYHGLLVAALAPPVARTLMVAALDITARYGPDQFPLATHEFGDGTIAPEGYLSLESFHLDRGLPVWRHAMADALLERRVLMRPGRNETQVHIEVLRASEPLHLELTPLCTYRDHHGRTQGGWDPALRETPDGCEIEAFPSALPYRLICAGARFEKDPDWYWNFRYRAESARGLDDIEDLYRPGRFLLSLDQGASATIVLSAEQEDPAPFADLRRDVERRAAQRLDVLPCDAPPAVQQLTLAADQFIVERGQVSDAAGKSVIAGYPWFGDWGRDTMIALPGLTLSTRRFSVAAAILRTYAGYVSEGMLPNRFPDGTEAPEYNTVDATLWFFHALDTYTRYSGDPSLAHELYPVLADIIAWHRRGTRYDIHVDTTDGLLTAGTQGVQLTWMDAKVDDWVVTPRIGKCVEINALWYNALRVMETLAGELHQDSAAAEYQKAADRARQGFQRFWNPSRSALYDVIDGPEGEAGPDGNRRDDRLRPNQIFAVSLPHSPLDASRQQAVVDVCARELLTSHGLRSLGRREPGYRPRYRGERRERDGAYHQGTVWAWLIGPFVDAHYRVHGDAAAARSFLEPLILHLQDGCLGTLGEIFDGDPPFAARGCFAQAWSVAEVLRTWLALHGRGANHGSDL